LQALPVVINQEGKMRIFKKVLLVLMVQLFCLSMMAFANGSAEKTAPTKEISLWYWDQNADETYRQMVTEFEKLNPGIKVKLSVIPWSDYWTKLSTALPSGTGPDVFWLNQPNAVNYLPTNYIMNLEDDAANIHFENFSSKFSDPYSYNGNRYGVPIFYDNIVLFYNKALFDKAGVSYPTKDWTWTEYVAAAKKLTIKDGKKTLQYGTIVDSDMQAGVSNFIYQNGGKIFSEDGTKLVINNAEAREAVQSQLDLIYKYGVAPTIQELYEITKANMFQGSQVAMIPDISANLKQFSEVFGENVQVAPLPSNKQKASIYHNLAYVASAKTKYPAEVKKLLEYLASAAHAEQISQVWASCYNGYDDTHYAKYNWIDKTVISDAITYGYPLPISSKNAGPIYTMLNNEMNKAMSSANLGDGLMNVENAINPEIK
jgi:multiple sugar transport system substrate-binding protein